MRIRIVEGPGAPAEHIAVVDEFGVVIDDRGYCPLDDYAASWSWRSRTTTGVG